MAHALAYDGRIVRDVMTGRPRPATKWASVTSPTLVITGEQSEAFFHNEAKALVVDLPDARHRTLEGQDHAVAPAALAPVLVEFFAG
jgi:pimeloyl-ACP methyl ester carboxylesterase